MKHLPAGAHILDAGCGVGRDSKYFLNKGYVVSAFDASQEMVNFAIRETGLDVLQLRFQDMTFKDEFDGIWASASLLHVSYADTKDVYQKIHRALKPGGIFYASYKYGQDCVHARGRDFWNMDELTILPYLDGLFDVIDLLKSEDVRSNIPARDGSSWLNFIVRKL